MKPHKHTELIKAWADGAEIEQREYDDAYRYWDSWEPFGGKWLCNDDFEYRIKPQPKEDYVFHDHIRFYDTGGEPAWICEPWKSKSNPNINVIFDGETKQLKDIKMTRRPGISEQIHKVMFADPTQYGGFKYARVTFENDVIKSILIL